MVIKRNPRLNNKNKEISICEIEDNFELKKKSFLSNIKVENNDKIRVFQLQRKLKNGEITIEEMTVEEIEALSIFYDEKITNLKQEIKFKLKQMKNVS